MQGSVSLYLKQNMLGNLKIADVAIAVYVFSIVVFESGSIILNFARIFLVFSVVFELRGGKLSFDYYFVWQIVLILYAALSVSWAWDLEIASGTARMMLLNGVCFLIILYLIKRDTSRITLILKILMISGIFLYGRILFTYGFVSFTEDREIGDTSANAIGLYSAIGCFCAFWGLQTNKLFSRHLCVVLLIANLIVVFLSSSRKALLAAVAFILLYILLAPSKKKNNRVVRFSVVVLMGLISFWAIMNVAPLYEVVGFRVETLINGIFGLSGEVDASTSLRLYLIQWGAEMVEKNPLIGYGGDCFRVMYAFFHPGHRALYSHNNYIEVAFDFGLIIFVVYYSLYVVVLILAFRKRKSFNHLTAMFVSYVIVMMVLEYGLVDYFERVYQLMFLLAWIVVSAPVNDVKLSGDIHAKKNYLWSKKVKN